MQFYCSSTQRGERRLETWRSHDLVQLGYVVFKKGSLSQQWRTNFITVGCWNYDAHSMFQILYLLTVYPFPLCWLYPETQPTKRQATQHGCLPSLLGDGDMNWNDLRWVKTFCTAPTRAAKAEQRTNQERTSFIGPLFEYPFTSVSTVSRGHQSLVSLALPPLSSVPSQK